MLNIKIRSEIAAGLLLIFALSGCSAMQPSAPTLVLEEQLSDAAVIKYGKKLFEYYNSRSGKAKVLGTSAGIVLSGLATGAQMAANRGASAASVSTAGGFARFISDALGITEPIERAHAYDDGATDVIDSLAGYMDATTPEGQSAIGLVPQEGFTKQGAALLKKLAAIQRVTNAQLSNLRYSQEDVKTIAATIEQISAETAMKRAEEKAAADARKLKAAPAPKPAQLAGPAPEVVQ
jgi:hypothetical protein